MNLSRDGLKRWARKKMHLVHHNMKPPKSPRLKQQFKKTIHKPTALLRNRATGTYVSMRCVDTSLKKAQGTDAPNVEPRDESGGAVKACTLIAALTKTHSDSTSLWLPDTTDL